MSVQNSNSKLSASPDLANNLLQILVSTTFNSLLCQKGNLHYVLKNGLLGKYLVITPKTKKSKLKILYRKCCLSKKEISSKLPVQRKRLDGVLAKSLHSATPPLCDIPDKTLCAVSM